MSAGASSADELAVAEAALLAPMDPPFTPLKQFVCTYETTLSNLGMPHTELIARLQPRGAIKVLNCNFGHIAQDGYERFLKQAPPLPEGGWAPPGPQAAELGGGQLAPAMVRQRRLQGDGTCFNSAVEAIIIPGPEDDPPPEVLRLQAQLPEKHYAVKSFPTTGRTQVPGVLDPDLVDGAYVARLWAKYLTDSGVGVHPEHPIEVVAERPIMQNFKFHLIRRSSRLIINLPALVTLLEEMKLQQARGGSADGPPAAGELPRLPFPIRELKHALDNQNISFKFAVSAEKKVRVNTFFRGKVNILGAGRWESARAIYAFLSELVRSRWARLVVLRPLPDRDAARRRPAAAKRRAAPEVPPSGAAEGAPPEPLALEQLIELAASFDALGAGGRGRDGGGRARLDQPPPLQVEDQGREGH